MNIRLIWVGKTDDALLKEMIIQYSGRISRYIPFSVTEIPLSRDAGKWSAEERKTREGQKILEALAGSDHIILLDEKGKEYSSPEFAVHMEKIMNRGYKTLTFVIGGAYGFSKEVYAVAHSQMALSRMTFNHQMVRVFFTEQLYRAFTIIRNEPYHH